jgi:hypothetical protein
VYQWLGLGDGGACGAVLPGSWDVGEVLTLGFFDTHGPAPTAWAGQVFGSVGEGGSDDPGASQGPNPAAVPEPGTLSLIGVALAIFASRKLIRKPSHRTKAALDSFTAAIITKNLGSLIAAEVSTPVLHTVTAGAMVLFAIGACPSHHGVRLNSGRINVRDAVKRRACARSWQPQLRSHRCPVPGRDSPFRIRYAPPCEIPFLSPMPVR